MPAEALRGVVTRPGQALAVLAWVPYTGGRYHLIEAYAGEWTPFVVHLRWFDHDGGPWDVWVPASLVQRSPYVRRTGLPSMQPATPIHPSRRPGPE